MEVMVYIQTEKKNTNSRLRTAIPVTDGPRTTNEPGRYVHYSVTVYCLFTDTCYVGQFWRNGSDQVLGMVTGTRTWSQLSITNVAG